MDWGAGFRFSFLLKGLASKGNCLYCRVRQYGLEFKYSKKVQKTYGSLSCGPIFYYSGQIIIELALKMNSFLMVGLAELSINSSVCYFLNIG